MNSDVGAVRETNQDSVYCGKNLLIVADGMGGHAGGDVASTITVTMLSNLDNAAQPRGVRNSRLSLKDGTDLVERSLVQVFLAILEAAKINPELSGMGTTLTGLLRTESTFLLFHLGDSRAYRLHKGKMMQLTKDHTFVQHLVDSGKISAEEAAKHPQKNVVMRVLGDFEVDLTPDYDFYPITLGDRYFLCSDGVNGSVTDEEIQNILETEPDPELAANKLVELAIANGSTDNCTAVVADVVASVQAPVTAVATNQSAVQTEDGEVGTSENPPVFAGAAHDALQNHLNSLVESSQESALKQYPHRKKHWYDAVVRIFKPEAKPEILKRGTATDISISE